MNVWYYTPTSAARTTLIGHLFSRCCGSITCIFFMKADLYAFTCSLSPNKLMTNAICKYLYSWQVSFKGHQARYTFNYIQSHIH